MPAHTRAEALRDRLTTRLEDAKQITIGMINGFSAAS
jgi:hypothetical protein